MTKKNIAEYSNAIPLPAMDKRWNVKLDSYRRSKYRASRNEERTLSNFIKFCDIRKGIFLEIGCGSGWFRKRIPDNKYIGLEVLLRKDVALDFPIILGLGECLPLRDKSVDCVLILATLDHVSDPQTVISEAFRVLKETGEIYILNTVTITDIFRKIGVYSFLLFQKIISFDYESIMRNFQKAILQKEDKYHTFDLTACEIRKMLLTSGYSEIKLKNFLNVCFFKGRKLHAI